MNKSFNKKQVGLAAACALALSILSGAASAQNADDRAYLQDARPAVVKSGTGLCWHTSFGPPPPAGPECDPNYVAYVAPPAAPPAVVAPAPVQVAALAPPVVKTAGAKVTMDADTLFDFSGIL